MSRYIRHAAAFCVLLLGALLVNTAWLQVLQGPSYGGNPANRRPTMRVTSSRAARSWWAGGR